MTQKSVAMFRLGLTVRIASSIVGITEKSCRNCLHIRTPGALDVVRRISRLTLPPMHAAMLCLSDTGENHSI